MSVWWQPPVRKWHSKPGLSAIYFLLILNIILSSHFLRAESSVEPIDYSPFKNKDTAAQLIGSIGERNAEVGDPKSIRCTAFLVGPDLIMTAAHCADRLTPFSDDLVGSFRFILGHNVEEAEFFEQPVAAYPFFFGARPRHNIDPDPIRGFGAPRPGLKLSRWGIPPNTEHLDFAVYKISKKLGNKYGWFQLSSSSEDIEKEELSIASYDQGTLTAQHGRKTHLGLSRLILVALLEGGITRHLFIHPFMVKPGSSGAPIWVTSTSCDKHPRVVGLNVRLLPEDLGQSSGVAIRSHYIKESIESSSSLEIGGNLSQHFLTEAIKEGNIEEVKLHSRLKTDLNHQDKQYRYGHTSLMTALWNHQFKIAKFLIEFGVSLDLQDNDGWTALMVAAFYNQFESSKEVFDLLVKKGAKRDIKNKDQKTAQDLLNIR